MTSKSHKLILEHKQVRKQQETAKKEQLTEVKFYVNLKKVNLEFFPKHGAMTGNLLYKLNGETKTTKKTGYFEFPKGSPINNETATKAFRTFLTDETVALPHNEVEYQFHKVIDNFNKFGESDGFGELKLIHTNEAHDGLTKYWKFLSNKKHSVKIDDVVQFGISFRNGIGTLTSLGGDFYSYRLWCANGAVAKNKRFSFSIPHRNSATWMLEQLTDKLTDTIENYKTLLQYYREFTKVKLTQVTALQIIKQAEIPLKYLSPRLFDVTLPNEENELKRAIVKLTKYGKESTLWDLFNSVTQPLSESSRDRFTRPTNQKSLYVQSTDKLGKIVYASFVERTSALHRAMFPLVEVPQIQTQVRGGRRN
jgi:hypothetical protein